ncbi:MAG: PH domain-containing protein [Bacillota bacterium]
MSDYKRQHPFMILMSLMAQLKSLIVPFVLIFIFQSQGGSGSTENRIFLGITLGVVFLSVLYSVFKWIFYTYRLREDALVVKSGVFIKKRRYIKPERVQTTSLEAGILLRIAGLVSLKVETAGSKKDAEFTLEALNKEEAESIKEYLRGEKVSIQTEEETEPPFIEIGLKNLFLAALTSGRVGVVFFFVIAFSSEIIDFIPRNQVDSYFGSLITQGIVAILVLLVVVLIISWIISIIRYVLRFALFKVEINDDELTITRGLIVKRTFRLKKHRIQAINITEGLLREPFSLASVECEVAGGGSYEQDFKVTLLPLCKKDALKDHLTKLIPEYAITPEFTPLPRASLRRYIIRSILPYVIIAPAFFFFLPGLLILLTLPVSIYLGVLRYKNGGYDISENMIVQRSRFIAKRTVLTKRRTTQDITLSQNILQKRKDLMSFSITVMSTPSHNTFTLKDIDSTAIPDFHAWLEKSAQNS